MPLKSRYNANFMGDVTYGRNVVMSIISLATQEIKGVACLQGKGVRTETIGKTINVDIYINVNIGSSCSDVAFKVQENIKRSVESMTEYKIGVINVNILGVTFKNQEN